MSQTPCTAELSPGPVSRPCWADWPAIGGLLLLYVLTISRASSIDAYYYFNDLEHGRLADLLHPHHLVYELLGWVWYRLWRVFGYAGRSALPLKLLSLAGAGGALLLFVRTLRRTVASRALAQLLLAALGVCYLPWYYATEGEPVAFFLLFSCWFLLLATRPGAMTRREAGVAGLVAGLGVLFHQALAFALPVAAWCVWRAATPPGGRGRVTAAFLASAAVVVAVPYLAAGRLATGGFEPGALKAWATGYLQEFGGRYGQERNFSLGALARGAGGAFLGGSALKGYVLGNAARDARYWLALVPYAGAAAALTLGLGALALRWRHLPEPARRSLPAVLLLGTVFLAAAVFWEPGNRKFWAPILPCLLLLTGWGASAWADRRGARTAGLAVAAALGALLIAGNLTGGILEKHRQRDDRQALGLQLRQMWQPGDLVVLEADRLWQSVDYHFPDLRTAPIHRYASVAFAAADTTLPAAARAARAALARGGRVFASSPVLDELLAKLREADPELAGALRARRLFLFHDPEEPHRQAELYVLERAGGAP